MANPEEHISQEPAPIEPIEVYFPSEPGSEDQIDNSGCVIVHQSTFPVPADELKRLVDHPENGIDLPVGVFHAKQGSWTSKREGIISGPMPIAEAPLYDYYVEAVATMPGAFHRLVSKALGRTPNGMLHPTIAKSKKRAA